MRLGTYFTLAEFTRSETAEAFGIDNDPPGIVVARLRGLVRAVLDPLREAVGPVIVTSGYRSAELNAHPRIDGAPNSAHRYGRAADIVVPGLSAAEVAQVIVDQGRATKVIEEHGRWCHVEYHLGRRHDPMIVLRARRSAGGGRTVYLKGLEEIDAATA